MPITKPYFKLYASDGTTLVYTFPIVQYTNAPQSHKRTVVIEGQRGKGCIIVDGGEASWDLIIRGLFMITESDEGYEDITAKIDAIETAIVLNTPYILRIDKTDTTYYEYKVKRILPIDYRESLRTDSQEYQVVFKVNSW
jgi:hypothetical protein